MQAPSSNETSLFIQRWERFLLPGMSPALSNIGSNSIFRWISTVSSILMLTFAAFFFLLRSWRVKWKELLRWYSTHNISRWKVKAKKEAEEKIKYSSRDSSMKGETIGRILDINFISVCLFFSVCFVSTRTVSFRWRILRYPGLPVFILTGAFIDKLEELELD